MMLLCFGPLKSDYCYSVTDNLVGRFHTTLIREKPSNLQHKMDNKGKIDKDYQTKVHHPTTSINTEQKFI